MQRWVQQEVKGRSAGSNSLSCSCVASGQFGSFLPGPRGLYQLQVAKRCCWAGAAVQGIAGGCFWGDLIARWEAALLLSNEEAAGVAQLVERL